MIIHLLEGFIFLLCFFQYFLRNTRHIFLNIFVISLFVSFWLYEMNAYFFAIIVALISALYCLIGLLLNVNIGRTEEKSDPVLLIVSFVASFLFISAIYYFGGMVKFEDLYIVANKDPQFSFQVLSRDIFENYTLELMTSIFLFFIFIFGISYTFSLKVKKE